MSPSNKILAYRRAINIKFGGVIIVFLEIFEIYPERSGLFLDKYKLSWIAFDMQNVDKRVLMDAHHPFGIHYHLDSGRQIPVQFEGLDSALQFFEGKVREHFGELE